MASVSIVPSAGRAERLGLSYWMTRVRKELDHVRTSPEGDPGDTVHDLRVAIRRCRSLAAALQEADPTPVWDELRKVPRKLFRKLGAWRDACVLEDWARRLLPKGDPVATRLLEILEERERNGRAAALRAAEKFDESEWKRLERTLRRRVRFVPPGGVVAQCLALERLEAARDLHARALRTEKPKPWHELRIGLKRFRYTVENLLPEIHSAWAENLKRLQDLLGDIHDLDTLAALLENEAPKLPADSVANLRAVLGRERNERMQTYRQLTLGRTGLWHAWRSPFPHGAQLEKAAFARLRVTARALDSRPRRTAKISRLAHRLFDALAGTGVPPAFRDASARRILRAAALLHGIGSFQDRKPPHKAARAILLSLPPPPGWSAAEWNTLADAVRYHRAAEPKPEHRRFKTLLEGRQQLVQFLAGILRLARALRRCGVDTAPGFEVELSADAMRIFVPGWTGTAEYEARLAAGKSLLEQVLKRPILIISKERVVAFPAPLEPAGTKIAAASD